MNYDNTITHHLIKERKIIFNTIFLVLILFSISFLYDLITHNNQKDIYVSKKKELATNVYNLQMENINNLSVKLDHYIEDDLFKKYIVNSDPNLHNLLNKIYTNLKNENKYIQNIVVLNENNQILSTVCADNKSYNIDKDNLKFLEICHDRMYYRLNKPIIYDGKFYGYIGLSVDFNKFKDTIKKLDNDILPMILVSNKLVENTSMQYQKINNQYSILDDNMKYEIFDLHTNKFVYENQEYYIFDNFVLQTQDKQLGIKILYMINIEKINQDFLHKSIEKIIIFLVVGSLIVIVFNYGFKYYRQELETQYQANIEKEHFIKEKLITEVMKRVKEVKQKDRIILEQSKLTILGEMLSTISHQWRQPLTHIKAVFDTFLINYMLYGKINDQDISKIQNEIIPKVEHLIKVINNFSEFFQPDNKKEVVNPDELLDSAVQILQNVLEKNNIIATIECNTQAKVKLYKNEYVQVLINIINNAIEILSHNNQETKKIHFASHIEQEKYILTIEDNGGGIDNSIIDKIFEPYFSTKSLNDRGLGLYMAKITIHKHLKGILSAYNNNEGAVFKIELNIEK